MAQNSQPLDLAEALQQIREQIPRPHEQEPVAITLSRHRIVATPVSAQLNLPPFPASAMDGYALRRQDLQADPNHTFKVVGTSLAGHPFSGKIAAFECVRVFTGSCLPEGADQVVVQEELLAGDADHATFRAHTPGESYIRPIGHDVRTGDLLLPAGETLNPFSIGMLAAAGVATVAVYTKPVVGVFSTGDELVDPSTPVAQLLPGQIYDSNRVTVLNLLADMPCVLRDLGRLPDSPQAVRSALNRASAECDLLITSGGVSVGDADFVTSTIEQLGTLRFWKLNLKPGKPLAFGKIDDCYIFGLPGNPVSTIVTLLLIAKPTLAHLAGANYVEPLLVPAILQGQITHSPGRAEYQRGYVQFDQDKLVVRHTGDQSSNRLSSFTHANCLIQVPKQAGDLHTGDGVNILLWRGLLG